MNIRAFALSPMVIALGLTVGLTGCSDSDSVSRRAEVVSTPTTPAPADLKKGYQYQIVFQNAATDALITDELAVQLTGSTVDANLVVDETQQSVKGRSITTSSGTVMLAADFNTTTGFSVVASNLAKGWRPVGTQISKETSALGVQTVIVKLLNANEEAAINKNKELALSVSSKSLTAPANGAVTTAEQTLSVALNLDKPEVGTAQITLPADLKALNPTTGAPLNLTGAISMSAVKYGTGDRSAMSSFPVGDADPSQTLTSDGFAQFNLTDSNGVALKKFDKPITLSIDLASGTGVQAGDNYPVSSYDESVGQWKAEADGVVKKTTTNGVDKFAVEFKTDHLSFWNIGRRVAVCNATLALGARSAQDTRKLSVFAVGSSTNSFVRAANNVTGSAVAFARYPRDASATVVVLDEQEKVVGFSATPQNLCNGGNVVIEAAPAVVRANLVVNVTESCPNGSNPRPSPTTAFFVSGNGVSNGGFAKINANGTAATSTINGLVSGSSGTLYVFNPFTKTYQTTSSVTVTAPQSVQNINFPSLTCQAATGATGTGN